MKLSEIKPFVRYARIQDDFKQFRNYLFPCDNRIFYCLDGKGEMEIDGKRVLVEKDMLIMWKCSISYKYILDTEPTYKFVTINFDFTSDSNRIITPLIPLEINKFSPSKMTESVFFEDVPGFNDVFIQNKAIHLRQYFENIAKEYADNRLFSSLKCSSVLSEILVDMARYSLYKNESNSIGRVDEILKYIKANCTENVSNSMLGKVFGYHPNYINSLVVCHTGMSIHKYLLICRIEKAGELLEKTNEPISQVAMQCGFSSTAYFSRYFKKITGINPSYFKK